MYIQLVSNATYEIPLETITIRHWFTSDDNAIASQTYSVYTAQLGKPMGRNGYLLCEESDNPCALEPVADC